MSKCEKCGREIVGAGCNITLCPDCKKELKDRIEEIC